jgi:predicted nucleotidyltransferase
MARNASEVNAIAERALATLAEELPISAAFLFGSHVEGVPHTGSDIDLAVFTPDETRLRLDEKARLSLRLQHTCAPDLELHLYSSRALERARPSNFYGYLLAHGQRLR